MALSLGEEAKLPALARQYLAARLTGDRHEPGRKSVGAGTYCLRRHLASASALWCSTCCGLLVDGRRRRLLFASALGGGALLVAADILVRLLLQGSELKLGVVTSLISAFLPWSNT